MTTNAEQFLWKFWQVTALSWTFWGHRGGKKFHWGPPPPVPPLEPPLLRFRFRKNAIHWRRISNFLSNATLRGEHVGISTNSPLVSVSNIVVHVARTPLLFEGRPLSDAAFFRHRGRRRPCGRKEGKRGREGWCLHGHFTARSLKIIPKPVLSRTSSLSSKSWVFQKICGRTITFSFSRLSCAS